MLFSASLNIYYMLPTVFRKVKKTKKFYFAFYCNSDLCIYIFTKSIIHCLFFTVCSAFMLHTAKTVYKVW